MHLTLIISSLAPGGAERVLSELAHHWVSQGHRVSLVTLSSPETKPFYLLDERIELIQLNSQIGSSPVGRLYYMGKRLVSLRKTMKALQPDCIVSFMDLMNLTTLMATVGLKIPVIVSERSHPQYHRLSAFFNGLRQFLYKRAAAVVMQTASAAQYFACLSNVHVIPNAVPRPAVTKDTLSQSPQHIVSIGRLCPLKGFETLIRAFAALMADFSHLTLTIYGEGKARPVFGALIRSLELEEKVFLPGTTSCVPEVLRAADLFVFSSHYEGFPNALCEAMAIGLPVIASGCSGSIDVVREGVEGRLFPIGDTPRLAALMRELLTDPDQCARLAENAKKVCDRFDPAHIYEQWDQLIAAATRP